MGTRGCIGFYKDGKTKVTYNHFDSYPDGLGETAVNFVQKYSVREMNEIFDRIVMVSSESTPSADQISKLKGYANTGVSTGSLAEWYVLLRETQGQLEPYANGLSYMIDSEEFLKDSLFCEWAYIINLDTNELEVYKGFQESLDLKNRYGTEKNRSGYYPVKQVGSVFFGGNPDDISVYWEDFVSSLNEDEEDEELDEEMDETLSEKPLEEIDPTFMIVTKGKAFLYEGDESVSNLKHDLNQLKGVELRLFEVSKELEPNDYLD